MNSRPRIVKLDVNSPDSSAIHAAAEIIRRGGLVAIPTETVYGLAANALDTVAVQKIFDAKGRPSQNPIIVHATNWDMVRSLVSHWSDSAQRLATAFWPGPLTLVLPKSSIVPSIVTANGPTVAIRWPAHPVAAALIREAGVPLAAPSANKSGRISPTLAEHVAADFGDEIAMILDCGSTAKGIESTVVDVSGERSILLRPGPIPLQAIEKIVGSVRTREDFDFSAPLPSPGLLLRHYAPRTPVELFENRTGLLKRYTVLQQHRKVGWLGIGSPAIGADHLILSDDPEKYAANLYAALHELDRKNLDLILIEIPPDAPAWLAVRDRLFRAGSRDENTNVSGVDNGCGQQ